MLLIRTPFGLPFTTPERKLLTHPPRALRYKTTTAGGILLWAERNFIPSPASLNQLRKNTGKPPFQDWKFLGLQRDIRYTYFDLSTRKQLPLTKAGIYLRLEPPFDLRVKVRQDGDAINGRFRKYEGRVGTQTVMTQWIEKRKRGSRPNIAPIADFKFDREEWAVGKFRIVLDEAQFHHPIFGRSVDHIIGKVELCQKVEDGKEKVIGRHMDSRIKEFMKKHRWAFPYTENVPRTAGFAKDWDLGKELEWFNWEKRWQRNPETLLSLRPLQIQGKLRAFHQWNGWSDWTVESDQ
ncbi:uncharacterized protein EI97DRAFT_469994 [Westerdykella ornata]|uniref:CYTH domain-containing protein n=1 Tax=Westerdykella ornata TaxID=318751 RepID=A0A6A6JB85_WESOR|nr:uncharacterized protein EI97DRAFT_469994 [Westerdykella ornata]KAF2272886.1 hypothetical protein EI97DRAFT_469994 [Westerdykella ornata]